MAPLSGSASIRAFAFRETWGRAPKFLGYTPDCFDDQDFAPRVFQVTTENKYRNG